MIRVSGLSSGVWCPLGYEELETAYNDTELRQVLRAMARLVPILRGTETGAYRLEARRADTGILAALSEYDHGVPVSEWISCAETALTAC